MLVTNVSKENGVIEYLHVSKIMKTFEVFNENTIL